MIQDSAFGAGELELSSLFVKKNIVEVVASFNIEILHHVCRSGNLLFKEIKDPLFERHACLLCSLHPCAYPDGIVRNH